MNKQSIISLHLILVLLLLGSVSGLQAQLTVHPGDVNNDGVVDLYDVVNFGVVYGDSGMARPVPGIAWGPYDAAPWGDSISAIGLDRVYGDVNGSGRNDTADYNALLFNMGQFHNLSTVTQPFSPNSPTGIPIFVDSFWYDLDSLSPFQLYATIAIGSAIGPAVDVDGIAMKIAVDTTYLSLGGPGVAVSNIEFIDSGLAPIGELLTYKEEFSFATRELSIASARISNSTIILPSNTPIFTVGFVMEGNIAGGALDPPYFNIAFQDIVLYNTIGELLPVWALADSIPLEPFVAPKDTSDTTTNGLLFYEQQRLNIYPQPAGKSLLIEMPGSESSLLSAKINVYAVNGQKLDVAVRRHGDRLLCDTQNLPGGNYLLTIETQHGILGRVIQIETR